MESGAGDGTEALERKPGQGTASTEPALDQPSLAKLLSGRVGLLPWEQARRFRIDEVLGMGANGRIYALRDLDLDRPLALKTFIPGAADDDQFRSFIAEARTMAELQHPNVSPIYDLGLDTNGNVFFTMKRIEGRSLGSILELSTAEQPDARIASTNQVVSIAIAVCSALAYAHHRGVVHQDVKPDNIMIGDFGEVLLIDWGSAVHLAQESDRDRLYATPLYMSPEQANRRRTDARSDVYCMGATLFQALLFRLPTMVDEPELLWDRKRRGDIDAPSNQERRRVPSGLLAIALKALAADPAARYQDASAMLQDLQDFQAGLAVSARVEPLFERLARWYRRNRKLFWLSGVSALLIAAVTSLFAIEKAKERASWRVVYDASFAGTGLAKLDEAWTATIAENMLGEFSPSPIAAPVFAVDERGLVFHGNLGYTDLTYRGDLVGDIRVEWTYRCDRHNLNFNCFIGGPDRWNSNMFHVGSWNNAAYVALTRDKEYHVIDSDYLAEPLAAGRSYRFVMEQEAGRLRLLIDGRAVFDVDNPSDAYGGHSNTFGFDAVGFSDLRIDRVRVLHKPMPLRISPLIVADKLLQLRDYPRAAQQYLDIITSYPGTALAPIAQFRYAVCCLRAGDAERSCALLERLVDEHPDSEEAPFALYELIASKRRSGDLPAVAALLERCVRWKGHAALSRVMAEIADSHMPELAPLQVVHVGDPEHRPDLVARIESTFAELRGWGQRFGVAWWKNTYVFTAGDMLKQAGAFADVLAWYPRQAYCHQLTLLESARYDEILAVAPEGSWTGGLALMGLGREQEVVAQGRFTEDMVWDIRARRGDLPLLLADRGLAPTQWARTLVMAGRFDEALSAHPDPKTLVAALIGLGRARETESRTQDPIAISRALVELREYARVEREFPTVYENLYLSAEHQWFEGDRAACSRLLADLERAQVPFGSDDTMFGRWILPGCVAVIADHADPAATFAPVIATCHDWYQQRVWYLLSYVVGAIDDAGFRAQKDRDLLEERLLFAQALAHDLHGRAAAALAGYARIAELPWFRSTMRDCDRDFVRFRMRELARQ